MSALELTAKNTSHAKVADHLITAWNERMECRIRIPQDPGGAGKFEAYQLVGLLQGWSVSEREEGHDDQGMRRAPHSVPWRGNRRCL